MSDSRIRRPPPPRNRRTGRPRSPRTGSSSCSTRSRRTPRTCRRSRRTAWRRTPRTSARTCRTSGWGTCRTPVRSWDSPRLRTRGNYARNSRIPRLRRLRTCRRSRRTSFPRTLCMPPYRRRAGSFGTTSTRSGCRRWRSCRWSCSSRSYVVALSLTGRVTLARATRPTRKPDRHVGSRVVSAPRTHGTVMARVAGASA